MTSIFSWGANSHGQLGLGFESEQCEKPEEIKLHPFDSLSDIKTIKGGGGHVLILMENGNLYGCGWNHKGQLGIGNQNDVSSFVEIHINNFNNSKISYIACGWDSSAAVTDDGLLYVCGSNAFGQLGFNKKDSPIISTLTKLDLPFCEKVKNVTFGLRYICILTNENNVYLAGRVKFSNKCDVIEHNNCEFLRLNMNLKEIRHLASGSNHIVYYCDDDKKVIGVGDNKFNQCVERYFDENVIQLECGWTHNGVLTADDTIKLWGRNTYGQLGNSRKDETNLGELNCKGVVRLHLGSEHGMVLTKQGTIYTWGWNEHGNCGNGGVDNVYQPTRLNLPGRCVVCGTGAGFCFAVVNS